jgi:hypothetical protein
MVHQHVDFVSTVHVKRAENQAVEHFTRSWFAMLLFKKMGPKFRSSEY